MWLAQEHNWSAFFPAAPKSPGSWHRGSEHATVLEYITTELKDAGWGEWENKLPDCVLWGGLTWHDIWEQSLSSLPMRNGFLPKMNHIPNVILFLCASTGRWMGLWGYIGDNRANSSPMALGTGLSICGGSTLDRPEKILQEAPQIFTYSSFQVNLLVLCLPAFVHGGGWWGNVLHLIPLPLDSNYSVIS